MTFNKKEYIVKSSDGIHDLQGVLYIPDGEIKGLFQVVHGMTEYIGRYDRFMKDLCACGYLVFGYDHLGHGKTAKPEELGYIAQKNGYEYLVEDVGVFSNAIRLEYGQNLPYILLGHSMGSFIARLAAETCVSPTKLIIMGTAGPNPVAGMGILLLKILKLFRGEKHISPFMENIAFGTYNQAFKDENDPRSWLTKDTNIRAKYSVDPLCNYHFTVSALQDLVTLQKNCNSVEWYREISKKSQYGPMPILLVSGEMDPVGENGKGVTKVYTQLKNLESDVKMHLYPNCRHEILNEDCYVTLFLDILSFVMGKEFSVEKLASILQQKHEELQKAYHDFEEEEKRISQGDDINKLQRLSEICDQYHAISKDIEHINHQALALSRYTSQDEK